ncbi:MAG: bifunctional phosphoribosylaminoimidazolecarboxamide formyltransferase/IMP cyclohydrolase PurH, partial [Oligoflexales bacterium]|nr:bifunctional phosphoribosylaminoimidazolecarboxamide formyltransferase/IMP cyclohydrolase PurH [Oligoflexales bacterium]
AQYEMVISSLEENSGMTLLDLRRQLAVLAFQKTAEYEMRIANEFLERFGSSHAPERKFVMMERLSELRYGENPHQKAALYNLKGLKLPERKSPIATAETISGKGLSYNNLLDADAAWRCLSDIHNFSGKNRKIDNPNSVVIIKHLNPCSIAVGSGQRFTLERAWEEDPVSSFGGIIAFSAPLEEDTASWLSDKFVEVILAPSLTEGARAVLERKKNLRIILTPIIESGFKSKVLKSIDGGLLFQDEDTASPEQLRSVTSKPFPEDKKPLALFGIHSAKHLKSNAIAIVAEKDACFKMIGAGMGQPNRIDSTRRLAFARAREKGYEDFSEAVLISDAFFPFPDNVEAAAENGIRFIVQPGGSVKDEAVISECDSRGIAMAFTGVRHFRH